eukprot:7040668-Alexandrium_andersonii.AAC.1
MRRLAWRHSAPRPSSRTKPSRLQWGEASPNCDMQPRHRRIRIPWGQTGTGGRTPAALGPGPRSSRVAKQLRH